MRDQLAPVVAGTAGARLEVKPASVAVHVRQVADRAAGSALLEHVGSIVDTSLTKKPGKDVLEVAVTDADKGSALRRLRGELGAAGALYLGDDRTDEDGFRALEPDDVTVKVGDGETAARYRVADPAGALALLEHLAASAGLTSACRDAPARGCGRRSAERRRRRHFRAAPSRHIDRARNGRRTNFSRKSLRIQRPEPSGSDGNPHTSPTRQPPLPKELQ